MMPKLGTVPGEDFDGGKLAPAAAKASKGVPEAAQEKLMPRQWTATESRRVGSRSMPRTPPRPRPHPARGFRPLTVCDREYFFVKNPLNPLNSLDLHLQKDSPGEGRESCWPPAPSGKIIVMLRPYGPQETPPSIITRAWQPPAVKAVK
jgi:hypothetical protein